jgi:hypothetical protein
VRPHQTALLLAAVVSLVGMVFAPVEALLLPLRLLNTHLHELGHALVALGTGGTPQYIRVNADGSGVTPVAGGFLPLVASAGYLGAATAGAAIVYAMRTEQGARRALGITGAALVLSLILFVRGDIVGVLSGALWAAVLIAASRSLRGPWLLFVAGLIGLQQGINALRSLSELLQITALSETHSDARLMESTTYIPALVWAALWAVCGLAVIALTVRRTWAPRPPAR